MKSKRILSLVLALCLCLTMLPVVTMRAEAAVSAPTSASELSSRMNSIVNGTYGIGKYFRDNQSQACYFAGSTSKCHGNHGGSYATNDSYCNCKVATADIAGTAGGIQCFGYARYVFYQLFGLPISTYMTSSYYALGSTANISTVGQCSTTASSSNVSAIFGAAKMGDFIQARTSSGGSHSMIVYSISSTQVTVLECNHDGQCYIGTRSISWSSFASQYPKFTVYRSNNYPGGNATHNHSYSGSYYEAAHPHKVYQMCSCGATQYTGGTTTVSTCDSCNPVTSSSKYDAVLSFKAYLKGTSTVYPYSTAQLATTTGGEIWSTDECTITAVYSNGACKVTYPAGSSTKTAYTSLSNFVGNTSASLTKQTVNHQVTTYIRASTGSTVYGYISAGDVIYKLGTSGSMTQIFYPTSSGHKLAWVLTSELVEPTYDTRFNPYCPIKGYPCATATFNAYDSDYSTDIGDIWTSDYCTINAVYADGWCQVTYPVSSGTKTGYTQLSNFVYNTSYSHVKYTATSQTTVYTTKSLGTDPGWYISAGDVFYVVGTYGSSSQVLYPIDAQYGGGYKLGWIYTSALPKTTYTVSYNANGGSSAPSSQTKTHGTALTLSTTVPSRTGYAFVGWATSASATSATYAPGASYTTDANITLYAVWTLNKYEITYNANGGTNAPATQNKAHGTNLTLSSTVPTKTYTVTFNANGGTVDVANRQISCEFMGWATSSSATSATYQPGGTFTTNANTTLYAVWKNAALGQYSVPVREGYVFDGWYTAASGGTQVTLSTVVSSDMTVYAHWIVATYGVHYDANGGDNAPAEQIKTYGQDLELSTTVPTRENYTFLGWATEENPDEVQYQPGDTYSADMGIMLIAVWKCDLNPAFTVGSISGKPGDTVTVPIRISENPGIIAARLKISYDSDALTLTNVTDGGILGEYEFGDTLTANPYIVSWSNGTAQTDYSANGDLVYLTFKIAENATAGTLPVTVSYDAEEIYNKAFENITFAMNPGIITVEESEEADPNAPQIVVEGTKARVGETVSVTIAVKNNPGIASLKLTVSYDTSLTLTEIVYNDGIGGQFTLPQTMTSPVTLNWVNATADSEGDWVFATLTFTVSESATTGTYPITVTYDPDDVYDLTETNVEFALQNGSVEVIEYIPGDINGDGKVNNKDATRLLQYLSDWNVEVVEAALDVNGDGKINNKDATRLLQYLSDWNVEIY